MLICALNSRCRGCVHLIIDTETPISSDALGEGIRFSSWSGSEGDDVIAAVLGDDELATVTSDLFLRGNLLPRLFPGVAPLLPSEEAARAAGYAAVATVQFQQASVAFPGARRTPSERNHWDVISGLFDSEGYSEEEEEAKDPSAASQERPPSIAGVSPAAVCCLTLPQLASDGACSAEMLSLQLHLSSPLPDKGTTVLARYGQGFLDASFEPTDEALIIMVGCCSAFRMRRPQFHPCILGHAYIVHTYITTLITQASSETGVPSASTWLLPCGRRLPRADA